MKLALLLLFVVIVLADNTIDMTCRQCDDTSCVTLNGGGFDGKQMKMTSANCQEEGTYPMSINFECDKGQCSQGCFMTVTAQGTTVGACSTTAESQAIIIYLNILYSLQENDGTLSSSYDWCGCGGWSTIMIVGIVAGVVVAVGIIGAVAYFFCIKKKKADNYGAMADTIN